MLRRQRRRGWVKALELVFPIKGRINKYVWGIRRLIETGVEKGRIYSDLASGKNDDDRSGLEACLKALREGDVLVVWRLDCMGRNLHHLVRTVNMLSERGVGLKVLTGHGVVVVVRRLTQQLRQGDFHLVSSQPWRNLKES